MDFKEYIPFEGKSFRSGQEESINKILASIDSGNKFTILNASVGAGKSLVGYILAKYFEQQNLHTYLCTATKILQSQYINDFTDVKTIKGRMNFDCLSEPLFDCAKGMCQSHANYVCERKPLIKDEWFFNDIAIPNLPTKINTDESVFFGDPEFDDYYLNGMCEYWKQKAEGVMSPITMLNYDYLITDTRFVHHLPYRKLLICDEAHNLENILMRQLETRFSPKTIKNETGIEIKMLNSIDEWIDEFRNISYEYKKVSRKTDSSKTKKRMQEKYVKFEESALLLESNPDNWVCVTENKNNYPFLVFKPIRVSDYTHFIFDVAQHVVLMTGTILKQDVFARDLGIDDFSYIETPSIIPPKQRPIIKSYVGSMSRTSINKTMPNLIQKIKILSEKHFDEKGVLHVYTYNISKRLEEEFYDNDRFLFHNSKNKEEVFQKFKNDKTNKILVSPVAFEGVDFPYDQARWQCICKEPFPNIMDPQISVRDSIDYGWVFRQRCLVLSQMYGRTNRAEDDYSITYLLDSRIESLLGPSSLVTDYFLEALDGLRYNDELVLQNNAYDKLTKDTSRRKHDFDREVEKNILNDISDGLNTLCLLRKGYKEFSSDAYKYIEPAVQRLLKNNAIKYKDNI